jgi:hypothetical protein
MRKYIFILTTALTVSASIVAVSAASAVPSKAPLVIAMKDPGCHWFYTGGGPNHRHYAKSITRLGPVTLLNLDEAALIVKGPGGTKIEKVGQKLTLSAKGTYRITMVNQAPDDNHLLLKIT